MGVESNQLKRSFESLNLSARDSVTRKSRRGVAINYAELTALGDAHPAFKAHFPRVRLPRVYIYDFREVGCNDRRRLPMRSMNYEVLHFPPFADRPTRDDS